MQHGSRVASIEADLGADMTPGRQARWERLEIDRDDPGMALEDAWFRSALDDVVPADAPDRAARIEAAVDLARERFLAHGEQTWPQEALDLLDQQPAQDQRRDVEHDDQARAVSDQPDRNTDREVGEQQQDAEQQEGPAAAGAGERTEPAQAPDLGRQAQRFETELFSGVFGGAVGQHQQIGDAANEIHQQRPKTERLETEQPETEQPEVELELVEHDEVEP